MVEALYTWEPASWPLKSAGCIEVTEFAVEPRTVDELIRNRARELPSTPLVSCPHQGLEYVDYAAQQLDQYAYHVAQQYASNTRPRNRSTERAQVVAILGLSSLDYLVSAMAILKLGHTGLHLSTRISHEAYIDLLRQTDAVVLLVDDAMHEIALKCKVDIPQLQIAAISKASEYVKPVQSNLDTNMTPGLEYEAEQDTVAWIIHSSGSTGLPKPIFQTQRAATNNYKGNMNMKGFITLPLFHSHGISSTYRAIYSGKQIHIYNAKIPLTKQYLMEGMRRFNFVRPSDVVKPYLRMEDRGEGLFEAVCLSGWPSKVPTDRPDGSYAMKDLFTKHPQHDWWKYYGRLDDTIVLVNGEKAMPLPVEGAARQHPMVSEAVVFGKGRDRLGLALVRAPNSDKIQPQELARDVLNSIEKVQIEMPAYARITPDMVFALNVDTDYPRTEKGTVIRMKFYKRFESEIEALYQAIDNQKGTSRLNETELRGFLRQALRGSSQALNLDDDDQDFFNAGMDSLQATRLRAAITKEIDIGDNQLGINVAFEHPTISSLAQYLYALRTGISQQTPKHSIEEEMQALIEEHSTFAPHAPQIRTPQGNSVILTGVTGSLGAHMASLLAQDPSITTIYCLVRATSDTQAEQRVTSSLAARGIAALPQTQTSKLIARASDLTKPALGLSPSTLSALKSTVTSINHSAWSVNFNLSLSSFSDCIASVDNLMQFALSTTTPTPATFTFCGSVSTNMGYAQSKLVTEHLCDRVSRTYGLPTRVLRIGQIIGDTGRGVWNKQEAISTMMQAAVTVGALSALDEYMRLLPVDVVARSCVDIALQPPREPAGCGVYNVLNPHTMHWTNDLIPLLRGQGLEFNVVPVDVWLERLRVSEQDPSKNAPIKLLDFWTGKYGKRPDDGANPKKAEYSWDTSNTAAASPNSSSVDREAVLDVLKLSVGYFRRSCW